MLCAVHAVLAAGAASDRPCRMLVCTPSHTASDVVTRRLGQHLTRNQLFRLYAADRPIETVPVEVLGFCRQSDDQTGTFVLPDVHILMQFQVIVCTCSDAHLLYRIGLTNQQLRARRRCFQTFLQKSCEETNLECTLTGVDDPHFTHLFIDEAAQATEPESLIPLSVVADPNGSNRKVEFALVGDPRQLSPSVYSSQAATAGLERSWMERLLQRPVSCLGGGGDHMLGPELVKMEEWLQYTVRRNGVEQLSVFLTLNYRGHPSFLMMPSVLFYSDKLHSMECEKEHDAGESFWCEKLRHVEKLSDPVMIARINDFDMPDEVKYLKQFCWPLHFRGVVGQDTSVTVESGFASSSWANLAEAQAVVDICVTLAENGVSSQSIGVMSPFRGQVVLIRKLLRTKNLGGVNVGTIEDYQSVEHDVIVLSLTRSTPSFVEHDITNRMGVFGQPKRSNVALTRAEFLFVVVRLRMRLDCLVVGLTAEVHSHTQICTYLAGREPFCDGEGLCVATVFAILPSQWSVLWGAAGRHVRILLERIQVSGSVPPAENGQCPLCDHKNGERDNNNCR
jgi:AAA domain